MPSNGLWQCAQAQRASEADRKLALRPCEDAMSPVQLKKTDHLQQQQTIKQELQQQWETIPIIALYQLLLAILLE